MACNSHILLTGDNLGERHHYLNRLVKDTYDQGNTTLIIENHPESTPIDKIFKIDLAAKERNVDYILKTLKDPDILFVTRALKCEWIFNDDYSSIINPSYLEKNIFIAMIKPAVNKMKHLIQTKVKNPERCELFYLYYKHNFDEAIKYLGHCSPEFVVKEVSNIIGKINPEHFKRLCKINSAVGPVYFNGLKTNREALARYLDNESKYFDGLKSILKADGNIYLDLVESYFNVATFNCLSKSLSKYIMQNYKDRILQKCELYSIIILNTDAVANCLTSDECKDLVLKVARAEYLEQWFSYKRVEPFIKRIKPDERAAFKKKVFVEKDVGDIIKEWPYPKPTPLEVINDDEYIFKDIDQDSDDSILYDEFPKMFCKKRKGRGAYKMAMMHGCSGQVIRKTQLDILFDRYRFIGFTQAFTELTKCLQSESTIEGRQNIMLVLVSKSGGIISQVESLLKLLIERHKNEPSNLRAAIIRSFVKRQSVWRIPDSLWNLLLDFGHGLGLDGGLGEPLCLEGLHASILHYITNNITPSKSLVESYKNNFSTFKDYKLNVSEVSALEKELLPLLLQDSPKQYLDFVMAYNFKVESTSEINRILVDAARDNPDLINQLYNSRIGRRQLISLTFPIKQNEASYMNALRHDISLLADGASFAKLLTKQSANHDLFLRKLMIYFSETNGLAAKHLSVLEKAAAEKLRLSLARPIAMLSSDKLLLNKLQDLKSKDKESRKFAAALRSNAHNTLPSVNIDIVNWHIIGPKAVANRVLNCEKIAQERYIKSCLKLNITGKIAFILALNSSLELEAFRNLAKIKPKVALTTALKHYFRESAKIDTDVWNVLKELLVNMDTSKLSYQLQRELCRPNILPKNIEADYYSTIYQSFEKTNQEFLSKIVSKLKKHIMKVDENIIRGIVNDFIQKCTFVKNHKHFTKLVISDYLRIIAKYLILSKTCEIQYEKIENVLNPLFDRIESIWDVGDKYNNFEYIQDLLLSFKYTEAFIDPQYVSVVPVFEALIVRLQKILPREEYFATYVKIHLTMLYFKTIRQAISENNELFVERNKSNAMRVVGVTLGEYIGADIRQLVSEYFVSIVEIYKDALHSFLNDYFSYSDGKKIFEISLVEGIMKNNYLEAHLLAQYVLQKQCQSHRGYNDIYNALKQSQFKEVQFYLNSKAY